MRLLLYQWVNIRSWRRGDPRLLLSLKTQGGVEKWLFTPVYWYDVKITVTKPQQHVAFLQRTSLSPGERCRKDGTRSYFFNISLKCMKNSRIWDQNAEVSVKGSRYLCWNQSQMFVGEHGLGWCFRISLSKVGLTQRWLPVGACGSLW